MPIVRNLVLGLCVGLFCSDAQAGSDFRNWNEFANWCRSTGGNPLPNPPRCIPRQPDPPQTAPPRAADNFDKEIEAYSNLVDRLTQGVPNPTKFEQDYRTMPEHSDELSERLHQLYDFLAGLREYKASELDDAIRDRNRAQTISGEIAELDKETAAIERENKTMAGWVELLDRDAQVLAYHACAEQTKALRWFKYFTPQDSLSEAVKYYGDSAGVGTGLVRPTRIPTLKVYVEPASPARARSHRSYPIVALPSDYSNIGKISYVDNSYGAFLSLEREKNQVDREYDHRWLRVKDDELYRLERLRNEGLFEAKQLAKQIAVVHQNFVVKAVESFVWKTYVTHISIEEAKTFYGLNKSWYQLGKASQITDDEVKRKVEEGKAALDILGSRATGMKAFLDIQKRTLDLIANTERFLLEAPEIAALATPGETQTFLRAVDKEQGDFSIEVLQAYKGRLAPSSPLAQALRRVKVPRPYQNIAKSLGLADDFED